MWVVRLKNNHDLVLFAEKPVVKWDGEYEFWDYNEGKPMEHMVLPNDLFPNVTYNGGPLEVEIVKKDNFKFELIDEMIKAIEKNTGKSIEDLKRTQLK